MRISDWSSDVCSSDLLKSAFRMEVRVQVPPSAPHIPTLLVGSMCAVSGIPDLHMHKGCREPRALTAATGFSLQRISGALFPVLHLQVRQARRQLPSPFHLPCHHWQIPAGLSGIFSRRSEEHTS